MTDETQYDVAQLFGRGAATANIAPTGDEFSASPPGLARRGENRSRARSLPGYLLFAFSVTTSPVAFVDPMLEMRSSGVFSSWGVARRRGQKVSLREARLLALRVMTETESRLRDERASDFRFFISFDQDGAPTAA